MFAVGGMTAAASHRSLIAMAPLPLLSHWLLVAISYKPTFLHSFFERLHQGALAACCKELKVPLDLYPGGSKTVSMGVCFDCEDLPSPTPQFPVCEESDCDLNGSEKSNELWR